MKTYLVVNPKSANGDTGRRWAEIQARLSRSLSDISFGFTERPMHASELAREALRQGHEVVVAVGGDGTINETLNGFFHDGKPINPNAALGVLPRGTGGDFRRSFDWSLELEHAVERLRRDSTEPFDVGQLEYTGPDGGVRKRYFANICSFGASGLVDREVNKSSKVLGGKLSFMLASAKAMMRYRDQQVRFRVDSGAWDEGPITTLAVANGKFFGGGMKIAPGALTSDGLFDITVWTGYSIADFAIHQSSMYSGDHVRLKGTRCLQGRVLEAESEEEVLIDCDGEQPGRLPCKMTLLPGAVRLKV
jgi:YegS/Rv2252/BmrU family lipid kinase